MGIDLAPVLLLTAILFAVLMKHKYSARALLFSIVAGSVTLMGLVQSGTHILFASANGLLTFMMWYCLIAAVMLAIGFLSRNRNK